MGYAPDDDSRCMQMDGLDMVEDLIGGVISNAAYDIIKAAARDLLRSRVGEQIDQAAREQALKAYQEALEEWLVELIETFRFLDFGEDEIRSFFRPYQEALPAFLRDEEVADELLRPFTEDIEQPRLDHVKLIERWEANGFPALPREFPAPAACRKYIRRLNQERIVTPELRDLLRAQMERTRTELLRDLRGDWPEFDLDQFRQRVRDRYRIIDLSALTPPERTDPDDPGIRLRDVFVPQDVREYVPVRDLPKEYWREVADAPSDDESAPSPPRGMPVEQLERLRQEWATRPRQPVLQALGDPESRRVVILGDPGSGKSTLSRYLVLSLLESDRRTPDATMSWTNPLAGHLPLLVELKDYIAKCKEKHCVSFLEYWHHLGKSEGFALNIDGLDDHLSARPSLAIFDGLDEVLEGKRRSDIVEQIVGFARDHPAARIILTSRITGYQRHPFDVAGFRTLTLQDLTEPQIESFARGWFDIVFHNKPDEAAHRRARISSALRDSPAIRQLAGNPLLLTMIAIIARHQELPRDRAKLYDHAVKVLCHHWDLTRHKLPQERTGFLGEEEKLGLLRRIAWRLQREPQALAGNYILEGDLRTELDDYFADRWQLDPIDRAHIVEDMIKQLRERNFILCLYGSGIYGFVHRTFLEFLCAQELVLRFEKQRILSEDQVRDDYFVARRDDEVWHEILRLVCGTVAPRFAGLFIGAVTPRRVTAAHETDAVILAVQCLSEVSES